MKLGEVLCVFILIIIAIIIFYFVFKYFYTIYFAKKSVNNNVPESKGKNICPICHSSLFAGENITSRVYKEDNAKEQSCRIYGCPHCHPKAEFDVKRECPVCHRTIPQDGYLRAFLFTRESEKKHVHVVGCTECQRKRR